MPQSLSSAGTSVGELEDVTSTLAEVVILGRLTIGIDLFLELVYV
jgi:hypothetical protein